MAIPRVDEEPPGARTIKKEVRQGGMVDPDGVVEVIWFWNMDEGVHVA